MADEQDLRHRLSSVLDNIGDDTLRAVVEGIFSLDKLTTADFECPECGKNGVAKVRTPDYRGFTMGLAALADQGKGKPSTAAPHAPEMSEADLYQAAREVLRDLSVSELARLAS